MSSRFKKSVLDAAAVTVITKPPTSMKIEYHIISFIILKLHFDKLVD